jgi:hypothetical protein
MMPLLEALGKSGAMFYPAKVFKYYQDLEMSSGISTLRAIVEVSVRKPGNPLLPLRQRLDEAQQYVAV